MMKGPTRLQSRLMRSSRFEGARDALPPRSRGNEACPTPRSSPVRTASPRPSGCLRDQWLVTEATWSDSVRQRFEERYLAPIESAVDAAVNGMQKMAEVLDQVRRDCSDRSELS